MSASENIDIRIREDGSRVVRRNIDDVGTSAERTDKLLSTLKATIAAVVTNEIIHALIDLNDEYTRLQNRLRLTTSDQGNLNAVFDALIDVAAKTRSELAPTVEIYQRIATVSKDLGLSQQEVIDFTLRLNEAVKNSGVTSQEAANGVRQLAQGMAAGRLQGQDLRAVLEDIPAVGNVIAQGLGVTRGALKSMGEQGKITAQDIIDAFKKVGPEIDAQFAKTLPTIEDGFTALKNQALLTVGALSSVTGAGAELGQALVTVANYLKAATPEILNFTRALFGTLDPSDKLSSGSRVFTTILVTLIGVLKIVATIIITVVVGAFKVLGTAIGGVVAAITDFAKGIVDTFLAVGNSLGGAAAAIAEAAHGDFEQAGKTLKDAFTDPFKDANADFAKAGAELDATWDDVTGSIIDGTNALAADVVDSASGTIEKLVKIWDEGARDIQNRNKDIVGSVSTTKGPAAALPIDPKLIEKLKNELRALLNTIDPISGAILTVQKAVKTLDDSRKAGLITQQQEIGYLIALGEHYRDILDPLGKLNREIAEQITLLGFTAQAREVESQVLAAQKSLLADGVKLTQDEVTALRDKYKALQDVATATAAQDALLAGSVDARKQQIDQLDAIQKLSQDKNSGFSKSDATNALAQAQPSLFEGTQEQLDAQMDGYQRMYDAIDQMRARDLVSEQTAVQMKAKVAQQINVVRLSNEQKFFGDLSSLARSGNSTIAAIGKAAAVTQATIDGVLAVQKALASAPPPVNFALAVAAGVAAAANVATILGVNTAFATGGQFAVGGSGGTDSQLVAFRATPGEQVAVSTPGQLRKGDPNGGPSGAAPQVSVGGPTIINVRDPKEIPNAIQGADGRQAIINVLTEERSTLKHLLSS